MEKKVISASDVTKRLVGSEVTRVCISEGSIYIEFDYEIGIESFNVDNMYKSAGFVSFTQLCISLIDVIGEKVTSSAFNGTLIQLSMGNVIVHVLKDRDNLESFVIDGFGERLSSNDLVFE